MKQGYIYIAIATIMFSTFEVALKYIAGEINSVQLTFARFFIGFLFLAPLAWRTLKKRGLSLDRKSVAYFALLGLVGIAICTLFGRPLMRICSAQVVFAHSA